MKKTLTIIVFVLILCPAANSQEYKKRIGIEFLSNEGGWYIGVPFLYELGNISTGIELKQCGDMSGSGPVGPIWSVSAYANLRHHYKIIDEDLPNNSLGIGGRISIFSVETNFSFGNNQFLWDLTPSLALDFGSFSLSYGYKIPFVNYTNQPVIRNRHVLSLKYAFGVYAYFRDSR